MRFFKAIGLFIVVLVVSLTFNGACLYAIGNETNETNSNTTPTCSVGLPVYKDIGGLGSLNIEESFMNCPAWGECYVWKPFINWFNKKGKDKWYNLYHFWYYIAYPLAAAAETIVFNILILVWFILSAAWVLYAIPVILVNLPDLLISIGQIFLAFHPTSLKDVKTYNNPLPMLNVLSVNNSTNTLINKTLISGYLNNGTYTNGTNASGNIKNGTLMDISLENTTLNNATFTNWTLDTGDSINNDTIVNGTLINGTLLSGIILNNNTNDTVPVNITYANSLSNSGGIYENATKEQLTDTKKELEKTKKKWIGSLNIIDGVFSGLSNLFDLIDLIVSIVSTVSAALSVPTSGGSITTAVATETTKEVGKETAGSVLKEAFEDFILSRVEDGAKVYVQDISDKYTPDYLPKNEENEAENYYATVGIKAYDIKEAIDSLIDELKEKKSIKRSIFNLVGLGVSVVTKIGKLLLTFNFDSEEDIINAELEFRDHAKQKPI
jgi:hypothetical protein